MSVTHIEDILTTNSAGVNPISNAFIQSATAVPEPEILSLFGLAGVIGFAGGTVKNNEAGKPKAAKTTRF